MVKLFPIIGIEWIIVLLSFLLLITDTKRLTNIRTNIINRYKQVTAFKYIKRMNSAITPLNDEREKLEKMAAALEIDTKDKSDQELLEIILKKLEGIKSIN